jgi:hypothetical protein
LADWLSVATLTLELVEATVKPVETFLVGTTFTGIFSSLVTDPLIVSTVNHQVQMKPIS